MEENEIRKLESEIHQEFQLERVVLFSDAVFAIAITLMVIELKIPEVSKNESADQFWWSMGPLVLNFVAFLASFFFIGMFWYRHLKLCGLLIDYNRTFIILNLLFLFFIVLIPFSVSSFMRLSMAYRLFATILYFSNIFLATVTHFILYMYLLRKGKGICKPISDHEKKILIEQSLIPVIFLSIIMIPLILSATIFHDHPEYFGVIFLPVALVLFFVRRRFRTRHKKIKEKILSNSD
ncbi:MAG TPA: TMEM175 family protein [Chitinophagales bacterium]|nr:TMEM175 family protein [Chitinophagales bacterium]